MKLETPLNKKDILNLNAGQDVFLSGIVYTARDQAHKRLVDLINQGENLPFNIDNQIIYYCGPSGTPKNRIIGSCGPTTSSRMDRFVRPLLDKGLTAMIGKGGRSREVREAIKEHKAVYFLAPSGCGALLSRRVISNKLICFKDLGPEAVFELEVKDFPLIVGIDQQGKSVYDDI